MIQTISALSLSLLQRLWPKEMSDILNLNCWVLGNDPHGVFPLNVTKFETVGGLKKAIKEEIKSDAAAHTLNLWKVSNWCSDLCMLILKILCF